MLKIKINPVKGQYKSQEYKNMNIIRVYYQEATWYRTVRLQFCVSEQTNK